MANITRDEVVHLASLSSIALTDDEIDALAADIASILDHIATLQELDTSDVDPTYQVTDLEFVSRPDTIETSDVDREALLALAPEQANYQIKVPKVL